MTITSRKLELVRELTKSLLVFSNTYQDLKQLSAQD